jgi:hypothetical protein
MRDLQIMALSALAVLVPYQPELFLRQVQSTPLNATPFR